MDLISSFFQSLPLLTVVLLGICLVLCGYNIYLDRKAFGQTGSAAASVPDSQLT